MRAETTRQNVTGILSKTRDGNAGNGVLLFYFTPQSITVHFTLQAVRSEANVKPTGGDSSNNTVLFSSFASLLLI